MNISYHVLCMYCVSPTYQCPVAGLGAGLVPTEDGGRAEDRQVVAFTARSPESAPSPATVAATASNRPPPLAATSILRSGEVVILPPTLTLQFLARLGIYLT